MYELNSILIAIIATITGVLLTSLYFKKAIIQLNTELGALNSNVTNISAQLIHETQKADHLKAHSESMQADKNFAEQNLARTESELDGVHVRLKERDSQILKIDSKLSDSKDKFDQLQDRYTRLNTSHKEKMFNFEEQKETFEKTKNQMKTEFENLASEILEKKGETFSKNSQTSLDALLKPLQEKIDGFQKRINEVHTESIRGNTSLEAEVKKVLNIGIKMSSEANSLAVALKGEKKTAGNWGEAQLERTLQLAGLIPGDHYEAQEMFKDNDGKNKFPDFVIKLPDHKHMIIDSKVSLVDYDRAVAGETEDEVFSSLDDHVQAVKNHIDDLSGKDYTNLIGIRSPSFVLMFMPIEPAYIEAMKHSKDLFNYAYNKNVILVSHTTLMPILRTVTNLWMMEQSNKEAREISNKAGDIYNQVCSIAENLHKLGNSLSAVGNHYNKTVTSLIGKQGLHGKVERFSVLSAKANKSMPNIEPLHKDIDYEKLELVVEAAVEITDESELNENKFEEVE